jgi:protein TonB
MMGRINPLYVSFVLSCAFHSYLIGSDAVRIKDVEIKKPIEVELRTEKPEYLPDKYRLAQEKKIEEPIKEEQLAQETIENQDVIKESILRYQDSVKQKIQEERRYPRWALRLGREGAVRISFNLLSSGEIKDVRLLHPSGIDELDTEAMDAVKRASPFLPFPSDFGKGELQFEIDIVFRLVTEK